MWEWLKADGLHLAILLGVALFTLLVARRFLLSMVRKVAARTSFEWDDVLVEARVLYWLSYALPAIVIQVGVTWTSLSQELKTGLLRFASAAMVLAFTLAIGALLNGLHTIYLRRPEASRRPLKGYVQSARLIVFLVGGLAAIAALLDKDPLALFAGIGALAAVLMLVFKDTILSLVASVQLTTGDMVRVGDWVEIPALGVDGDITEIALHTVKVKNFDNTVTTVPTSALVSKTVKNWRGMQESGGRRIKRSLCVDMASVRFLEDEDLERLSKYEALQGYIADKQKELAEHNAAHPGSERRMTNVGTFRAYVYQYLKHHPAVHDGMTLLVRQLQPTEHGLPIEMYLFTKTTKWADYEAVQSDVVDHLLAVAHDFDLRVFQRPTGADVVQSVAHVEA